MRARNGAPIASPRACCRHRRSSRAGGPAGSASSAASDNAPWRQRRVAPTPGRRRSKTRARRATLPCRPAPTPAPPIALPAPCASLPTPRPLVLGYDKARPKSRNAPQDRTAPCIAMKPPLDDAQTHRRRHGFPNVARDRSSGKARDFRQRRVERIARNLHVARIRARHAHEGTRSDRVRPQMQHASDSAPRQHGTARDRLLQADRAERHRRGDDAIAQRIPPTCARWASDRGCCRSGAVSGVTAPPSLSASALKGRVDARRRVKQRHHRLAEQQIVVQPQPCRRPQTAPQHGPMSGIISRRSGRGKAMSPAAYQRTFAPDKRKPVPATGPRKSWRSHRGVLTEARCLTTISSAG